MHPIRNIILVTLLGIVSSNAYCAWEKIAGKGNEGLYVNLENLRFSPQSEGEENFVGDSEIIALGGASNETKDRPLG